MSGVEVAGLVLGCLPLIIQGIESYNEGLDPVKAFMRWERELPQFIRKLRNQHVHYEQTIRILLTPITTEFELAEMISDPSGELWKDKDMSEKLQGRLQESYLAYQSTIKDIERIVKKIASKLDLDRAAELTRNDLEAIIAANPKKANDKFEFRKRIRFGMSKKSIKALLEELDDCNKELERFTDKSEKVETARKSTKPSFAARLQRIQSYAKTLHDSLSSSWSCSCKAHHKTSLQLEPRDDLYLTGLKKANAPTKTSFTVSFASSPTDDWSWQAAEIHVEEDHADVTAVVQAVGRLKMTKSVSFGDKPPPPYSIMPISNPVTAAPTLQEVKDLCSSIQKLHKSAACIGFSLDSKSKLRGAYPVTNSAEKGAAPCELVTLEELITQPPVVNGRPAKLSRKERYQLALTLASSALQLNSTGWVADQWCAKDILFHRTSAGTHLVDVKHPYVRPMLTEAVKATTSGEKARVFRNKNTVLLALAVALLELYFCESAESHQHPGQVASGAANPWALCAIVYEWTEQEQENLSAAFLGAVRHCLRSFNDPASSLQDAEFLQAAVEGIVLPLQDEVSQFLGKTVT